MPRTKQAKSEPSDAQKHGRRYPWKAWFALGKFVVFRGKHYDCQTHGMAQMIRNVASRRGLRVSLEVGEDTISVSVVGKQKKRNPW